MAECGGIKRGVTEWLTISRSTDKIVVKLGGIFYANKRNNGSEKTYQERIVYS